MQKWPLLEPRCLERSSHDGFLSERSLGKLKSRTRLVRREGDFRYSGCAAVRHHCRYVHLLCNNTLCLTATPRRMATPPARRTRLYLYCAREPFLEKYWSGQNRTSRTACAGPNLHKLFESDSDIVILSGHWLWPFDLYKLESLHPSLIHRFWMG